MFLSGPGRKGPGTGTNTSEKKRGGAWPRTRKEETCRSRIARKMVEERNTAATGRSWNSKDQSIKPFTTTKKTARKLARLLQMDGKMISFNYQEFGISFSESWSKAKAMPKPGGVSVAYLCRGKNRPDHEKRKSFWKGGGL